MLDIPVNSYDHVGTWSSFYGTPIHKIRMYKTCSVLSNHPQKKVQVDNDQEKAQSEKKIPTPKTEVGEKTKLTSQ